MVDRLIFNEQFQGNGTTVANGDPLVALSNTLASTINNTTGGNTITFTDLFSLPGDFGVNVLLNTTDAPSYLWDLGTALNTRVVLVLTNFRWAGVVAAATHPSFRPLGFRVETGSTALGHLGVTSDDRLQLVAASGSAISGSPSTAVLTRDAGYDVYVARTPGIDTTTGKLEYKYELSSTRGTVVQEKVVSGIDAGTLGARFMRLGNSSIPSAAIRWTADAVYAYEWASGWPTLPAAPITISSTTGTFIDARSAGVGTNPYTISPATGVEQIASGVFMVPAVNQDYTIAVAGASKLVSVRRVPTAGVFREYVYDPAKNPPGYY